MTVTDQNRVWEEFVQEGFVEGHRPQCQPMSGFVRNRVHGLPASDHVCYLTSADDKQSPFVRKPGEDRLEATPQVGERQQAPPDLEHGQPAISIHGEE
ncbi:MAG: hypothetical protein R3B91_19420 [Planctomycetaceae bacterium]